jgi:hypothetical protein
VAKQAVDAGKQAVEGAKHAVEGAQTLGTTAVEKVGEIVDRATS